MELARKDGGTGGEEGNGNLAGWGNWLSRGKEKEMAGRRRNRSREKEYKLSNEGGTDRGGERKRTSRKRQK